TADKAIASAAGKWEKRKLGIQKEYERILRELQKSKIDGAEFLRLRRSIESLRPLREREHLLTQNLQAQLSARRSLLADWEAIIRSEFQDLERGAKKVSRRLKNRVEVVVEFLGDRQPIVEFIQSLGGRSAEIRSTLAQRSNITPIALADAIRSGRDTL